MPPVDPFPSAEPAFEGGMETEEDALDFGGHVTGYGRASIRQRQTDADLGDLEVPDIPPLGDLAYHPSVYSHQHLPPPCVYASFRGAVHLAFSTMQRVAPTYRAFLSEIGFGAFMGLQANCLNRHLVLALLE